MKRIYSTAVLIFTCTMSFAQFHYGVKAGLNLSNLHIKGSGNADEWKPAVHAGMWFSYEFTKRLTLANDLLYSEKGYRTHSYKTRFYYISFPTTIRYNLFRKFSVEIGGGPSYLVLSRDNESDSETRWNNKIDWGLCAGVRHDLSSRLAVNLRYEHGLSNVIGKDEIMEYQSISGDDPLLNPSTLRELGYKDTNRNIQLSISYAFAHK